MTSKIPLSVVPHPPKNSKPVSSKYPHSASPLNELYVGSRTPTSGDIGNLRRRRLRPARASSNTTNDSPVSSATRSPVIEEVIGLDSRSAISVSRLPNDSFLQREATSAESTSSRHGRPPRPAATNLPPSMQRTPEPPSNPPNRTVSADLEKLRARSGSLSGRSERQFSARSQLRGFLVESPRYRDGASENGNLPSIARRDSIKSETLNDSLLRRANSAGTAGPQQVTSSSAKQQVREDTLPITGGTSSATAMSSTSGGKSSSPLISAVAPARNSRRGGGSGGAASNGAGSTGGAPTATVFTFSSPPKQQSVRPPRRMQPLASLVPRDSTTAGPAPSSASAQQPALLPSLPRDSSENPLASAREIPSAANSKEDASRPKAQHHQALFSLVTTEGPWGTKSPRNLQARVLKNHLREIHPTPAKAQLNRPGVGAGATSAGPRGDSNEVPPAQPSSPAKATSAGSNAARASAANLRPALASRLSPRHAASQRRAPLLLAPPQQPLVHADLHSEAQSSTHSEERDRDEPSKADFPMASGLLMPAVRPNPAAVPASGAPATFSSSASKRSSELLMRKSPRAPAPVSDVRPAVAAAASLKPQPAVAAAAPNPNANGRQALDLGKYHMADLSDSFEERMLRSLQREQEEELSDLEEHEIRQHNDAVRQRAAAAQQNAGAGVSRPPPLKPAPVPTVINGVPIPDLNIHVRFSTDTDHSLDSDSEAYSRRANGANFNGSSTLSPDGQTLTRSQHYLEEMRTVLSGWNYRSSSPSQDVEDIPNNGGGFAGAPSSPVRFTHQRPVAVHPSMSSPSLLRAQSQDAAHTGGSMNTAGNTAAAGALQPLSQSQIGTGAGEELDLVYDACLNCYYDPRTMKYYEIV